MKKALNQKGQALIELIIFLPLMFALYSVIAGFANAINGSINQQKIVRSYYYYRMQNNSTFPKPSKDATYKNFNQFGMFMLGWKDYFADGSRPVMPCYKVSVPVKTNRDDKKCEDPYSETTTQYIRVGTAYGICGATYTRSNDTFLNMPDTIGQPFTTVLDPSSCTIR